MKAAIVNEAGKPPVYGDFRDPIASEGTVLVEAAAAALSPVAKARAAGTHYSSSGSIPFVVGVDGVGRLPDGRRVYFAFPEAPFGSMAERVPMKPEHCIALPDALDDATAAAIAIPGMSSWAALKERALLKPGETVLVNGATGTSGGLAVRIARHLGAKKVIATGRNPRALEALEEIGADVVIPLGRDGDALDAALGRAFREGVDIVLDYLWGQSAERILIAAAKNGEEAVPIRFIQIGSAGGPKLELPSAVLRSSALHLMGSGIGSIPFSRLLASMSEMLAAAPSAGLRVETRSIPLSEIASAWRAEDGAPRLVLEMK